MIRYLSPLYLTDKVTDKAEQICDRLEKGDLVFGTFVITLAESEEAAYELVCRIYMEYYKKFGTYSGLKSELVKRL